MGEAKEDPMLQHFRQGNNYSKKTESESPGAELKRKKIPQNINTEKEEHGGETTGLNDLDSPFQISSFIVWRSIDACYRKAKKKTSLFEEDDRSNIIFYDPSQE